MVQRSMSAVANLQMHAASEGLGQVALGCSDGSEGASALGKLGCNGCGQRAAGAVRISG